MTRIDVHLLVNHLRNLLALQGVHPLEHDLRRIRELVDVVALHRLLHLRVVAVATTDTADAHHFVLVKVGDVALRILVQCVVDQL